VPSLPPLRIVLLGPHIQIACSVFHYPLCYLFSGRFRSCCVQPRLVMQSLIPTSLFCIRDCSLHLVSNLESRSSDRIDKCTRCTFHGEHNHTPCTSRKLSIRIQSYNAVRFRCATFFAFCLPTVITRPTRPDRLTSSQSKSRSPIHE
jgi:hypothetical protein